MPDPNTQNALNAALLTLLGAGAGGIGGNLLGRAYGPAGEDENVRQERLRRWALAGALLGGGGTALAQGVSGRRQALAPEVPPVQGPAPAPGASPVSGSSAGTPKPAGPPVPAGPLPKPGLNTAVGATAGAVGTPLASNLLGNKQTFWERAINPRMLKHDSHATRGQSFRNFVLSDPAKGVAPDDLLGPLRDYVKATPTDIDLGRELGKLDHHVGESIRSPMSAPTPASDIKGWADLLGEDVVKAAPAPAATPQGPAAPFQGGGGRPIIDNYRADDIAGLERLARTYRLRGGHAPGAPILSPGTPQARSGFTWKGPGKMGFGLGTILPALVGYGLDYHDMKTQQQAPQLSAMEAAARTAGIK
jgi:hypothetical protein